MNISAQAAPLRRISEMTETRFDGVAKPYVPPQELKISDSLTLHRDWETDIDPVTYEVIRHNLWNINEEHGATIQRISGSPVAIYALDLNPSILTEDAEFVYFGPYMQYMSGVTDTQVKWILENRSDNPGHPRGRHVPRQRPLGGRRTPDGRDGDLPGVLGGRALLLDHQLPAPVRHRRHHARQLLPCGGERVRRRDSDSAGEDRRERCGAARHRGALPALIPQARDGGARFPRPARRQHERARAPAAARPPLRPTHRQGCDEAHHRQCGDRLPRQAGAPARRRLERPHLCRGLPAGGPAHPPRADYRHQEGRPADLRQRRHRAAGRRHERHLFRLARLGHGSDQRAAGVGPVFRGGRRAQAHRLRPDGRHAQLCGLPGERFHRADPIHGDLASIPPTTRSRRCCSRTRSCGATSWASAAPASGRPRSSAASISGASATATC